jgi:Na+-transporting NADH:ubiquinone oxidoreductase subunit C
VSKFNTNSNAYTIGFLAIMVGVVGIALASISSSLDPIIKANEKLDNRTKVLSTIFQDEGVEFTAEFVNETFDTKISPYLINTKGEVVKEEIPADYNFRNETRKPEEERLIPLYIYEDGDKKVFVLQMIGLGLWDEINGFLSLQENKKIIQGVAFDHKGETPGLGAEIVKDWFTEQFSGKTLIDESGNYTFTVYKAGKYDGGDDAVDGISGATITTDGVDAMLESTVKLYDNFLNKPSV